MADYDSENIRRRQCDVCAYLLDRLVVREGAYCRNSV